VKVGDRPSLYAALYKGTYKRSSAKVGDLVRIKSRFRNAPIGLVVSIERRVVRTDVFGSLADRVKVQWLDGNYNPYYSSNELEKVSESR